MNHFYTYITNTIILIFYIEVQLYVHKVRYEFMMYSSWCSLTKIKMHAQKVAEARIH